MMDDAAANEHARTLLALAAQFVEVCKDELGDEVLDEVRRLRSEFRVDDDNDDYPIEYGSLVKSIREAFLWIEPALRQYGRWTRGVPFEWLTIHGTRPGRFALLRAGGNWEQLPAEKASVLTAVVAEHRDLRLAVDGLLREVTRREAQQTPPAGPPAATQETPPPSAMQRAVAEFLSREPDEPELTQAAFVRQWNKAQRNGADRIKPGTFRARLSDARKQSSARK